eukprot:CAMPEP_0194297908 /NCGR_PEP_ID=MMETSP0169-20130528/59872_1 /TAXON_ID=218684 /ORGANISM="Corethron pennatum, Strain L29A3" /LENGTH=95 /DNA_ID=CAMNT_0039047835 /DNA_START=566 /DNA_END=853 /DNA_ORIENTATION=-
MIGTAARSIVRPATGRATKLVVPRRHMGGKGMDVQKNKYIEEWNGRREITEEVFYVNSKTIPTLLVTCVAFPYFCYKMCSVEAKSRPEMKGKPII